MKKQSLARADPVGDRFTLNGGQTGHVARNGVSRSKAPTTRLPLAPHDVVSSSPSAHLSPFITDGQHRARGFIFGRAGRRTRARYFNGVSRCVTQLKEEGDG